MSAVDAVKAVLAADSTLTTTLTGGVYTFEETKRNGIGRETTPSAFDANGWLKPCAVVKGRDEQSWGGIADPNGQTVSTRQMVEVWLYADGDAGYGSLKTARARVYALLHEQAAAATWRLVWAVDLNDARAPELNNACWLRSDYAAVRIR